MAGVEDERIKQATADTLSLVREMPWLAETALTYFEAVRQGEIEPIGQPRGTVPSPETHLLNLLERQEALAEEQMALKRDIEMAQEAVEEKWLNEGVSSVKTNRGTLYRRGQRLARFTAKGDGLVELLEQEGLGHLVTKSTYANDRSLLGWLNKEAEQDELGQPIIPEALKPHVWTDVKYDIRLRRS